MMCSQDCYLAYREQYEYVTNYDFDEIILPRPHGYRVESHLTRVRSFSDVTADEDTTTVCQAKSRLLEEIEESGAKYTPPAYSIYEMARDLFAHYGHSKAYLKLSQVVFFNDPLKMIQSIVRRYPLGKYLTADGDVATIRVWLDNRYFTYVIKRKHQAYFDSFAAINRTITCLKKRMRRRQRRRRSLSEMFDYLLGTELVIGREGKSIYNTRYTEAYDAHEAKNTSDGRHAHAKVDVERAFVSHFRNDMSKYFDRSIYDFDNLKFDLDYYAFLLNLYSTHKLT